MPYCDKCGSLVNENDKFCRKCGATLTNPKLLTCDKCGAVVKEGDSFCRKCGATLNKPKLLTCDKCGLVVKEGDRFCGKCGNDLSASVTVSAIDQQKNAETECIDINKSVMTCKHCGSTIKVGDRFCEKCFSLIDYSTAITNTSPANTSPVSSSNEINKDDSINENHKNGQCWSCFNEFQVSDESQEITCPFCKVKAKGDAFIQNKKRTAQLGRLQIAEIKQLKVDDEFHFGSGYNKWHVLNIDNGIIFAISSKKLTYKSSRSDYGRLPYNDTLSPVTWEKCSLRKWLNDSFYNNRFSDEEKNIIIPTKVINSSNPFYGTPGGNDTIDKVFCLSIDELRYYCSNDKRKEILEMRPSDTESYWLRSPGKQLNEASVNTANISYGGSWSPNLSYSVNLSKRNDYYDEDIGVRPCLCINANNIKTLNRPNNIEKTEIKNANVGDTLTFGFDEYLGPIEWRVLSKSENQLLVISKELIRKKSFFSGDVDISMDNYASTWETSDIRKWLNDVFLNSDFNDDEMAHIIPHVIKNNKTKFLREYLGGNDTSDKVFLLSREEVETLLPNKIDRDCNVEWWLRTSSTDGLDDEDSYAARRALTVGPGGYLDDLGRDVHDYSGIRPAIWIRIDE